MKINFTKLIVIFVLSNLLLVNFAFAQQPAPAAPGQDIKIDAKKMGEAHKTQTICEGTLRKEIEDATGKRFTTLYVITPTRTGNITRCTILPQNLGYSATSAGRVEQPPGSYDLQNRIEQGSGLSSKDIYKAYLDDMNAQNAAAWPSKLIGWSLNFVLSADRKSTRLNSSHQIISYAVFCLKK